MHRGRGGERARAAAVRHHQQRAAMAAARLGEMDGIDEGQEQFSFSDVDGIDDSAAAAAAPADPSVLSVGDNFYAILQVARDAGQDDIKRSFRKLALVYHPDKNLNGDQEIEMQVRSPLSSPHPLLPLVKISLSPPMRSCPCPLLPRLYYVRVGSYRRRTKLRRALLGTRAHTALPSRKFNFQLHRA
jgi:hypothetical protein